MFISMLALRREQHGYLPTGQPCVLSNLTRFSQQENSPINGQSLIPIHKSLRLNPHLCQQRGAHNLRIARKCFRKIKKHTSSDLSGIHSAECFLY